MRFFVDALPGVVCMLDAETAMAAGPALSSYVATWLETVRTTRTVQTWRNYRWATATYILPALGSCELGAIRRRDVRAFAERLLAEGRLGQRSARLVVHVLRAVLSEAVEDELIRTNPAARPGRSFHEFHGPARPALAGADERRFLDTARRVAPAFYALFLFLARTGCRIGEGLGLTWECVDLDGRLACLAQQPWPHGIVTALKNGEPRYVDLSAQLVLVLRNHRQTVTGPWCFPGPSGYPWHRSTVRRHFRRVLEAGGLRLAFVPHSLRHGFASTLLSRGESLEYVRRALGHATPLLTARLYGAHLPYRHVAAVDGLDDP